MYLVAMCGRIGIQEINPYKPKQSVPRTLFTTISLQAMKYIGIRDEKNSIFNKCSKLDTPFNTTHPIISYANLAMHQFDS